VLPRTIQSHPRSRESNILPLTNARSTLPTGGRVLHFREPYACFFDFFANSRVESHIVASTQIFDDASVSCFEPHPMALDPIFVCSEGEYLEAIWLAVS
jgi:hypothetical protein